MSNRIFTLLNKEFKGVNEAALLLGGFTLLSQILGLIRDRILASIVGVGPALDVYYASFRIPDLLYLSIASLASVTVLLPFLAKKINDDVSSEKAKNFMNNVFSAYIIFMVTISLLIAIIMPFIVKYTAPGFTIEQTNLLITVSRIMLLSPIFIGLSNLIGTVTQFFKKFVVFSLSPVLYNIGILFGVIFLYNKIGIYGLAVGVVMGAFLHFLIQVPVVAKRGFIPKFKIKIDWREIYKIIQISIPRTLTLSCNSIAFIFLIAMATHLKPGSISLFTFAYNLQSVPVGIIGISYSVAAFPVLVRSFSSKDIDKFINQIVSTAKQIIFWSLPAISLLIVLRAQIVRVILGSESFSWFDTRLTAAAVSLFAISLLTQGLVLLIIRGYYASGNTKKPLLVNILSSLMIVVFAKLFIYIFSNYPAVLILFENLLRISNVPGTIMMALPIAYAFGSILNFFLIWVLFKKDFSLSIDNNISKCFTESLISSFVMGATAYVSLDILNKVFDLTTGSGIFFQGLISGILGIIMGVVILSLFKSKELADILKALSNKFWHKNVVAPEQSDL